MTKFINKKYKLAIVVTSDIYQLLPCTVYPVHLDWGEDVGGQPALAFFSWFAVVLHRPTSWLHCHPCDVNLWSSNWNRRPEDGSRVTNIQHSKDKMQGTYRTRLTKFADFSLTFHCPQVIFTAHFNWHFNTGTDHTAVDMHIFGALSCSLKKSSIRQE